MGSKYTSQTQSGYNVTPPPDDGSTGSNNLITWANTKSKIGDPLLTLAQNINTALVNALDFGSRTTAINDTAVASDHMKTIECTAALTATLPDATTVGSGYLVGYINTSVGNVTINLTTATDTLNGTVNGSFTLLPGVGVVLKTNTAHNGYFINNSYAVNATNSTNATNLTGSGTVSATATGGDALVPKNLGQTSIVSVAAGTVYIANIISNSTVTSTASITTANSNTLVEWFNGRILQAGIYRTSFVMGAGVARIYKNGSALGTSRSSANTYTEDLTFAAGDTIQLFAGGTGAAGCTVSNFKLGIATAASGVSPPQSLYLADR